MSNNNKTPAIRFKGLTDAWEQRKLGDVTTYKNGKGHEDNQSDEGTYELINLNSISIDGGLKPSGKFIEDGSDTLLENDLVMVLSDVGHGDLLGRVAIIPVNNRFVLNQRVALLRINGNTNPYFLFTIINRHQDYFKKSGAGSSQLNISRGTVEDFIVDYPCQEEQRKIAEYFQNLDTLITLHQRKYDKLVAIKRSMLEKMFPREGSRFPEIRFAGFTDPWEQRKLSEVFSSYTDPVDIPHDGYERLGIRSHAKGTFHSYVPAGHELQTAQMHRVAANKFIVNITFGWEHAVAVTDENDAGKLVSHRFPQFSLSDELDPQFLKFIILDERFRHHLWLASPGGAGRNRVLNLNQMLQYEIQIPCVAEQRKIAGALINIDTLITLHQCKPKSRKGGSHVLYSYQV